MYSLGILENVLRLPSHEIKPNGLLPDTVELRLDSQVGGSI